MALNVTPTSGAGPYTLTIDLLNKVFIDGIHYRLETRVASAPGSCPVPSSSPLAAISNALLYQGSYIRTAPIPEGSCGVYKVDIVDMATDAIIDTQSVSIDNV